MQKNARKNMVFSVIRKANTENTMIINNLSGEKLDIIMVFVADSWVLLANATKSNYTKRANTTELKCPREESMAG